MLLRCCSITLLLLVVGGVQYPNDAHKYCPQSECEFHSSEDGEIYTTRVNLTIVYYKYEKHIIGFTSQTAKAEGTVVSRVDGRFLVPLQVILAGWALDDLQYTLSKIPWITKSPLENDFWLAGTKRLSHLSVKMYGVSLKPITVSDLGEDRLTELVLTGNSWATTSGLALKLSRLKKLSLSDNQIEIVHEGLVESCIHLEVIDLSRNKIRNFYDLDGYIYDRRATLREINLANNYITFLDMVYWTFFYKLEKLDVSYNKIISIEMSIIPKNIEIDLSFNSITTIDNTRYYFRVDRIVLAGQNISSLSEVEKILSNIDYELFEYSTSNMALGYEEPPSLHSMYVPQSECNVNRKYIYCKTNGSQIFPRRRSKLINFSGNPIKIGNSSVLEMWANNHVDLSQNHFEILDEDVPWQISNTEQLNLSRNNISYISKYLFKNMTRLTVLDLSYNHLKHVQIILYSSLIMLDISKNYLSRMTISHNSSNYTTKYLNLSHNSFRNILKAEWSQLDQFSEVDLGENNNLQCCGPEGHYSTTIFLQYKYKILNINSTKALSCVMPINRRVEMTNKWFSEDPCQNPFKGWVAFGCLLLVSPLVMTAIDLLHYYTHQTERDLAHHLTHLKTQGLEVDEMHAPECEYDAFVCHSHQEARWVTKELVPNLENDKDGHRLCIHYRDFPLGSLIEENIETAMDKSRKVIVVVSRAFLKSYWCKMELTFAWSKMVSEQRNYIIVIELDKFPKGKRPPILSFLMESRTYLEWPEESTDVVKQECWSRLRDALGKSLRHRQEEESKRACRRNCTQTATDDFVIDC